VLTEWNQKRVASSEFGTNVHAYAEALVLGTERPLPANEREERSFRIVDRAVEQLAASYDLLAAEHIIFDPLYRVAGMIDLVGRNRETSALAILDWKTCEEITAVSYSKLLPPVAHLNDNKIERYSLQLSIYAMLLADSEYSAYPSAGQDIELALIHIPPYIGADPVWMPLPFRRDECAAILAGKLNRDTVNAERNG